MREVVIGTAGHIDHGKSLLVRALTGTDPDRFPEEKARGMTLDIGFARMETPSGVLHFVDLPGHERFIKNMLAGATGIDLCLFVVAADEGVMPQTVEHGEILEQLQVDNGIAVVTKVDLVDSETRELALMELEEFLEGHSMAHFPRIAVSATTGEGLDELRGALEKAVQGCRERSAHRPFRLPIDRVFPVKGFGTVVTGTCIDGTLAVGERVAVHPGERGSKVRGVQVFGKPVEFTSVGRRSALNLPDIPYQELGRGMLAAEVGSIYPTRLLDVRVRALDSAKFPLKTGLVCTLHIHTQELEAHLHLANLKSLEPGEEAIAQIRMTSTVAAWPGDRFILRLPSPARTVAGGEILLAARRKARWARAREERLVVSLRGDEPIDRWKALLVEAGPTGTTPAEVRSRMGVSQADLETFAGDLEEGGSLVRWDQGRWWLDPVEAEAWIDRGAAWVRSAQKKNKLAAWLPRQEFLGRWQRILGTEKGSALLAGLAEAGKIEAEGDRIRPAGHRLKLTPDQEALLKKVMESLKEAAPAPRSGKELKTALGGGAGDLLRMAEGEGMVLRFGGDFYVLPASLETIRETLARRVSEKGPLITVPEFKDLFGLSRKYAMPLLEYLDDLRVTRREGDGRKIL